MRTENFNEELIKVLGVSLRLTTYQIGNDWYCHLYNVDPGAAIARASAATRELAVEEAMAKATQRLSSMKKVS
jgi:hypothetical protein